MLLELFCKDLNLEFSLKVLDIFIYSVYWEFNIVLGVEDLGVGIYI